MCVKTSQGESNFLSWIYIGVPTPTESLAHNTKGPIGMSIDNQPPSENKVLV
jgi:hypothetical protein